MHPRNFGSEKIVRTGYVSQCIHPLEIKTTTTKADSFCRLNFNVYIDLDNVNRQRAIAKDKNQRRPISLEEKHNTFIAAVRKRGNASCHQAENERQRKEIEQDHISSIKRVTWKFPEVSRCSRAKQRQRNVQNKPVMLFFAN